MEDLALSGITEELHKLNENISYLTDMLERKFGGYDYDNFNVTLYTDKPIQVSKVETIKEIPANELPTGEEV